MGSSLGKADRRKPISVLVIDDEEEVRAQLYDEFIACRDFEFHVDLAADRAEAAEALRRHESGRTRYGVFVIDLSLSRNRVTPSDGLWLNQTLQLIDFVSDEAEPPVKIIFSAYVTWEDSIWALQRGAWDVIRKGQLAEQDEFRLVVDSAVRRLTMRERIRRINRQARLHWLPEHGAAWRAKYGGQYLAVVDGKVVVHEKEVVDFFQKMEEMELDPDTTFTIKID